MKKIAICMVLIISILLVSISFGAADKAPKFTLEKLKMKLGTTQNLGAVLSGTNIDLNKLTSSNPGVLLIQNDGSLKAVSTGISTLSYTYENSKGKEVELYCFVEVTVNEATFDTVVGTKSETITLMVHLGNYSVKVESSKGAIAVFPEVSREGYVFEGFYKDEALTQKVTNNERFSANADIYCKWLTPEEVELAKNPDSTLFDDINGHWARNAIEICSAMGLFNGVAERQFGPDVTMNRAMAIAVIGRLAKAEVEGKQSGLADVPEGAYYDGYLAWAVENKIVTDAADGNFRPNAPISREEVANYMKNYIDYCGYKYEVKIDATFNDISDLSRESKEAIVTLYNLQIMQGDSMQTFSPLASVTRAQMAQIFYNFNNFVNRYH